jgi:hypothetical protein
LLNYQGAFSQLITNIYSNNAYHVRAVAQTCSAGTVYGQDLVFYGTGGSTGNGSLNISSSVRNLTSGLSGSSTSISANPGDMLMFMITLQSNGSQVDNVFVRDYLPANLIYRNQLTVSGSNIYANNYNSSGDITSGISLGSITSGQTVTLTYQVQVAPAQNFTYGTTTLSDTPSVTSSGVTNNSNSNQIYVTRAGVLGASTVSTGLTNNFWVDSFFLPLMLTLIGIWMLKSGMFFGIEKWLDGKKKNRRSFKAEKELNQRILEIRKGERI